MLFINAMAFANETPIMSDPGNPGPAVTAIASMSLIASPDLSRTSHARTYNFFM